MNHLTNLKIKTAINSVGFNVTEVSHHVEEKDGRFVPIFVIDGDVYNNVYDYGTDDMESFIKFTDTKVSNVATLVFERFAIRNSRNTFIFGGPQQGKQADLMGKLFKNQYLRVIDTINLDFKTLPNGKNRIVCHTNIGEFQYNREMFDTIEDAIAYIDTPMKHRSIVSEFKMWVRCRVHYLMASAMWEIKEEQSASLNEDKSPLTPEQHEDLSKSIAQAIEKEPQHKEDTMKTKSILAQSLEAIKAKTKVKTVEDCMNFEEIKQVFDAITGGSPALERIEYNEDAEACIIGWFDNGDSGCAFYADYGSDEKELCEYLEGVEPAEIATELFNGYMELAEHVNEIADYDGSMEHITINKPDFEAAQEAAKELEEEKMRKLKALTDAAETMIQEHGNEVKTEKHDDAEVLIDSIQDAVFGKEVVRLSAESRNMLRMKFFKGLGDYEVYDNSIIFNFNTETRVIAGVISGVSYDIVTLDAGVSPDKWAMDGRRNWRPLKKFIDWVKTGVWVEVTEAECQEQEKTYWDEMDRQEREEARENRAKKKREEAKKKKWEEFDDRWKKAWGDFERNWKHFEEKWGNQPQSNKQKLFQILGCKDGDNIKRAYRSWMKKMHPDLNPNADLSLVQEVNAMMDTFNKG